MATKMGMFANKKFVAAAAAFLLLAFVAQSVYFAANSTYTYDETVSVINGYYYLTTHDLRLGLSQPPLSAYLSAVPLFFMDVNFDFGRDSCRAYDNWLCAQEVLFESGNDASKILFLSRIVSILASALAGLVVFFWSRELFGSKAALLSLALFAFSPLMIGHGSLALTNAFLAFFVVLNLYLLYRFLKRPSPALFAYFSVSFALAVASKANAAILLPLMYAIMLLSLWRAKAFGMLPFFRKSLSANLKTSVLHLAAVAAITFAILLVAYQFQFGTLASSVPPKYIPVFEKISSGLSPNVFWAADFVVFKLPIPFPSFFSGAAWHTFASESKLSFLTGEIFTGTTPLFFPIVFLVKTPIALIALAVLGLFLWRPFKPGIFFLIFPILLWFGFFALTLNSGVQHILPVYPFLFVLAGRSARWLSGTTIRSAFVVALLLWNIAAAVVIAPNYLAYFNELAGGPDKGHEIVGVTNFDIGQDLVNLKGYMDGSGIKSIKLSYFGTADPSYFGINYTYLASPRFQPWDPDFVPIVPKNFTEQCGTTTGVIAVSATNYHGIFLNNKSCYSWLREHEPIARVGHTIFIYDVPVGS